MISFSKNPNPTTEKKCYFFFFVSFFFFFFFFFLGGGVYRKWFFYKESKFNLFFGLGAGWGVGVMGVVDGWTIAQAQTILPLQLHNVQDMSLTSSIYDYFIIWPSSVTLTINLRKQMFWTALLEDNNCAKLFWNPCINVPVMARTSSIYGHFDLYLTPMTLTFNLRKKLFQLALFPLKDNNCAKMVLKSMHKCTSYGSDNLNIWAFWHLFDPCDLDLQPI